MEKRKISAKIVADSKDSRGNRITTYLLQYPRFIHAEVMTHRMFSRNAASSRAIPFKKMVQSVIEDPFIPIAFQKDHKGMQGTEYLTDPSDIESKKSSWLQARNDAVENARRLFKNRNKYTNPKNSGLRQDFEWIEVPDTGVTKQLCNRLLEPFQWMTTLITATEFDNFFELRCPKYRYEPEDKIFHSIKEYKAYAEECFGIKAPDISELEKIKLSESHAEIHIQALTEAMWDARNESEPKTLGVGEWHIPFGDIFDDDKLNDTLNELNYVPMALIPSDLSFLQLSKIPVATARCARLSYETHDGEIDYEKDIKLHDQLLERKHASCFEHCAKMMSDIEYLSFTNGMISIDDIGGGDFAQELESVHLEDPTKGWCRNFRGFIPYRHLVNL